MALTSAYLLVFHGSRDTRSFAAASQLVRLIVKQLESRVILAQQHEPAPETLTLERELLWAKTLAVKPLVEIAALELTKSPLHQNIIQFARIARHNDYKQIKLLPLFLAAGIHIKEDIPAEVNKAKEIIGEEIPIKLTAHLGSYLGMSQLLDSRFSQLSGDGKILLAHGSRSKNGNASIQKLAKATSAETAYWSIAPSLGDRVKFLVAAGKLKIAILPYFLFTGKIFEAIADEVERLRSIFPQATLILGRPLGATPELAALIVEEVT